MSTCETIGCVSELEMESLAPILNRTYLVCLLLTGDADCAQAALVEAMEADGAEDLFRGAVMRSLSCLRNFNASDHSWVTTFPPELQKVAALPLALRPGYVLRILLGWPRDICASTLGLTEVELTRRVGLAAIELAQP